MASHVVKQNQQIVADYLKAGGPWPAKKTELAEWALTKKRWFPTKEAIRRICADELAEAMREEVFVDETGHTVRAKIPATTVRDGEQGTFWADLRTAATEHVQIGVAQRRNAIVADCYALSNVVRFHNAHHEMQIQLQLDFTKDVRERDEPKASVRATATLPSTATESLPKSNETPPVLADSEEPPDTFHAIPRRARPHRERSDLAMVADAPLPTNGP